MVKKMRTIVTLVGLLLLVTTNAHASLEAKTWPASPEAEQFIFVRSVRDEDLAKIYGGNKMRVYREVWEGIAPEDDPISPADRAEMVEDLKKTFQSR